MKKIVKGALVLIASMALCACGEKQADNGATQSAVQATKAADNLKDAFQDDFTFGVAVNTWQLADEKEFSLIKKHFNSITMENEMKPENILDWQASESSSDGMPKVNTENLEKVLKAAKESGLKLRGHTLIWHSQTPAWLFCKDYDESADYVNEKTMLARMESYIKQVITFCQENYPGVVYAWDVVNEAMADDSGYREDSPWYEIIGEEYIEKAFTFARKYAEKDVKLFYNDYNSYEAGKRDFIYAKVKALAEKGVIDGVGMQSHWILDYPSVDLIETAVEKYGTIEGIEIQLTEIDMHTNANDEATMKTQADRYKEIFEMLLRMEKEKKADISNVTFWGLKDDETWLTNFRGETSYPLLFDEDGEEKLVLKSLLELKK